MYIGTLFLTLWPFIQLDSMFPYFCVAHLIWLWFYLFFVVHFECSIHHAIEFIGFTNFSHSTFTF